MWAWTESFPHVRWASTVAEMKSVETNKHVNRKYRKAAAVWFLAQRTENKPKWLLQWATDLAYSKCA